MGNGFIIEFDRLIENFISNKTLINKIYDNLTFVKKHIDSVDSSFENDTERHIAYRELGSIVCSCIEALLKGVIAEIDSRCAKSACEEKCSYRLNLDNLDSLSTIKALDHLSHVRLIVLQTNMADGLMKLIDSRNYVHISKHILRVSEDRIFDKDYVYGFFDYYYELIDQLNMSVDYYFKSKRYLCLKEADGDDFESTKKLETNNRKSFYRIKVYKPLKKALLGEELSDNDEWYISRLDYSTFVNLDEIVEDIKRIIECDHGSVEDYGAEKERMLNNLKKHLKRKTTLEKINVI